MVGVLAGGSATRLRAIVGVCQPIALTRIPP